MSSVSAENCEIVSASLGDDPEHLRNLLLTLPAEAIEIVRPPLADLPYRDLVNALLKCQGLRLDFRGQAPDAVLAMAANQLIGEGAFADHRALLAEDIATLEKLMCAIVGGGRPQTAIRTFFAPGDLVWHLDRVNERTALRLLWPLGRPAGMSVTARDNIDEQRFLAFMRHEHPLLCQLDTDVLRSGLPVERLWAHRPVQLEAMASGRFPFIRDPARVRQIRADAISIHRVETPGHSGTYHRSSWANRDAPGLQIVITVAAD